MSEERVDPLLEMMRDNSTFLEALVSIVETSGDAETVRIAVAAITRTDSGMNHLRQNPFIL